MIINPTQIAVKWLQRLLIRRHRRFELFSTTYPGFPCLVPDKSSFLYMYDEIFGKGIYDFPASSTKPFIIDCGSNIGLSIIRLKTLYPDATIIGFEPDSALHEIAVKNIKAANCAENVTLHQVAVSSSIGSENFYRDGADGGSLLATPETTAETVPTVALSQYINQPVAFLKIDIEGAEYEVLKEVSPCLHFVENLFVEYHSYTSKPQRLAEILALLEGAGFRYYLEHVGIRSENIFKKVHQYHGMDLQINIYGYRHQRYYP
jgi:FkbM family methyltransferase